MSYNSKTNIHSGKKGYPSKTQLEIAKGDKESLIEKNRRIKISISIAFFGFFSISNSVLQLLYALSPSLWLDSFLSILIPSLGLVSAVLNLISLVYFIIQDGINQPFKLFFTLRIFTASAIIILILFDIVSLAIYLSSANEGYHLPFPWMCVVLSLFVFISSYAHGEYCCYEDEERVEYR
jgi:hypothetical protein